MWWYSLMPTHCNYIHHEISKSDVVGKCNDLCWSADLAENSKNKNKNIARESDENHGN